jgi:hypothetical protein
MRDRRGEKSVGARVRIRNRRFVGTRYSTDGDAWLAETAARGVARLRDWSIGPLATVRAQPGGPCSRFAASSHVRSHLRCVTLAAKQPSAPTTVRLKALFYEVWLTQRDRPLAVGYERMYCPLGSADPALFLKQRVRDAGTFAARARSSGGANVTGSR